MFRGYWRKTNQGVGVSDSDFTVDNFFRTGDLGCIDSRSGRLRITGRKKEMILRNSENVYPSEVASVVKRFRTRDGLHVKNCYVFGVADEHGQQGELVHCAIVLGGDTRL